MFPVLLALAAAQMSHDVTPTPPLPPANPIAFADPDDANVMAPVNAMLAGLAAQDAAAIRAQVLPDGGATMVSDDASGTIRHLSWDAFLAGIKPGSDSYEERLTDPAIESDGKVALVWSSYVFYLNGKPDHCGTDHFDLVHTSAGWKVANVTWSQRSSGCGGQ
jgi:hypothetical protein